MLSPNRPPAEPGSSFTPPAGDVTVGDLLRVLMCWRGTIAFSVAIAIALAAAYWLAAAP